MTDPLDDAIASLEDYLRRYPSGNFAELAQARLDRLLAKKGEQRIVPIAPASPLTRGTLLPDPNYQVGDWYDFRLTEVMTGIARDERRTVTAVTELKILFNDGDFIVDPIGNTIRSSDGRDFVDAQHFPGEYAVGKRWTTRFQVTSRSGTDTITVSYAIKAREKVTVPAGTFEAFRGEGTGWAGCGGRREYRWWAAPDRVRRILKWEMQWWDVRNTPFRSDRAELIAFSESQAPA